MLALAFWIVALGSFWLGVVADDTSSELPISMVALATVATLGGLAIYGLVMALLALA